MSGNNNDIIDLDLNSQFSSTQQLELHNSPKFNTQHNFYPVRTGRDEKKSLGALEKMLNYHEEKKNKG